MLKVALCSEELYVNLEAALLERVRDKEVAVRVQAVVSLGKLQDGEDPDDLDDGEQSLTELLVDVLQYDPAPYVCLFLSPLSSADVSPQRRTARRPSQHHRLQDQPGRDPIKNTGSRYNDPEDSLRARTLGPSTPKAADHHAARRGREKRAEGPGAVRPRRGWKACRGVGGLTGWRSRGGRSDSESSDQRLLTRLYASALT